MEKLVLSDLFRKCAYRFDYKQAGDSVNYAFVEKGDTLFIYFEGSNSISDWFRNFWFFKKPYKEMEITFRIHGGFLAAWKEVQDIVIAKITELKSPYIKRTWYNEEEFTDTPDYKFNNIITVGYSHGGALSGLCHECVWFNRPDIRKNIYGVGFESPRFYHGFRVKKALKERWENYEVVRNHNDIVTHLPPFLFCFTHVGQLLKIGQKKKYGPIKSHYPDKVLESLKEREL